MDTSIKHYLKAKESFHINRPYGIRIDYASNRFVLFNREMNTLGEKSPKAIDTLPLEYFNDVEAIPTYGAKKVRNGNILDIYFYTDKTDPFIHTKPNLECMRIYNQYIYPLSLLLNRCL